MMTAIRTALVAGMLSLVICSAVAEAAEPPYADLPDPLVMEAGQAVTSVSMWENSRRAEILELFTDQVYGRSPAPGTYTTTWQVTGTSSVLSGAATQKNVTITVAAPNGDLSFPCTVTLPNSVSGPAPAFMYIGFSSSTGPAGTTVPRGYGFAVFDRDELAPDDNASYASRIISKFNITGADAWMAVAAWGFGASRLMDYLQTDPDVDPNRIAVIGWSRTGKAALWCSAQDERFAMTVSNNSGCTGAALARHKLGESVEDINGTFPYWFCENYEQYNGAEETLPIDQHQLLALIAPRLLCVGSASTDDWADPVGEFYSCVYAQPVFELLGVAQNTWATSDFPAPNSVLDNGNIHYHLREGPHGLETWDWDKYMDYADVNMLPVGDTTIDSFTANPTSITAGASSTLSWTTSNADSVTLDGNAVAEDGSQTVTPSATTTYTLVAQGTGGPAQRQVTVTVAGGGTVTLPLKVNCGTNEYEVAGWERDDAYVAGGNDYTFGGDWDTSAPGSAPADVYRTCRNQNGHTYSFPVPDGDYTVRLHLGDAYGGDRQMDYTLEGVRMIENLDVAAEAGGTYRSLVKELDVTVSDGNGLQIQCTYDSGVDVFECGIEIAEGGGSGSDPVLTTVSITPQDVTMYASTSRTFDADTLDQYGNAIASSVTWSVSGGGTVSPTTGPTTVFTSDGAAGDFTLTASAGGVHATATVAVTAATDSDSDGMDDGWETTYFGDLSHDGSEDTDADGATDYEEFLAGTDPTGGLDAGTTGLGCASAPGCAGVCLAALLAMFAAVRWRRPCRATERCS